MFLFQHPGEDFIWEASLVFTHLVKHLRHLLTPRHPSLHTYLSINSPLPDWSKLSDVSIRGVPAPPPSIPPAQASPLEGFANLLPPAGRLPPPVGPRLSGFGPPVVVVSPRHVEARVTRRRGEGRPTSSPRRSWRRRLVRRSRGEEAPVGRHVGVRRSSSCTSSSSNSSSLEDAVEEVVQIGRVARTARVLWRRPGGGMKLDKTCFWVSHRNDEKQREQTTGSAVKWLKQLRDEWILISNYLIWWICFLISPKSSWEKPTSGGIFI